MATLDSAIYSQQQFGVAIKAETTVGTALKTSMQRLNVTGLVGMSQSLIQSIEPRSGESRVQDKKHIFVCDKGAGDITVSVPIIMDTTVDGMLHENVMGAAAATIDTAENVIALAYNYSPAGFANGATGISDNLHTFTVALISPETDETIYLAGCVVTELSVSMDSGTECGRRHATVTFMSRHRPATPTTAPTTPSDYGTAFRFLRDLDGIHTIGGDVIVCNKLEYTISNPLITAGVDSDGYPEVITRGVPKATATGVFSIKYDANTAELWELRSAGTTLGFVFSNHTTWGHATNTFGIRCEQALIVGDVNPAAGDSGVFEDLNVEFMSDKANTKHVVEIIV